MARFSLKIEGKIVNGFFKERLNRFSALVKLRGEEVRCFLPNPGRLKELLIPNTEVFLKEVKSRNRLTNYDLIAIKHGKVSVFIDSRMPNRLLLEALKRNRIKEFSMYNEVEPEFRFGHSKFDFFLTNGIERCIIEAKSCTLVKNGKALFPDAPTERGRRHVLELIEAKKEGYRACILFLIQRPDANSFSLNDEVDPKFGEALREASMHGVEIYAYLSCFDRKSITLLDKVKPIFK
ncbi:MAG: DNA/RNA nuclease SfsA [archaeon]|nr:DNA/RNA nuclease SfsA [archaeon]